MPRPIANDDQQGGRALPLKAAYPFGMARGLEREINDIRDMEIEWDRGYLSSVRRGYIVELFERRSIFEDFKTQHWPFANTPSGDTQRRRYLRIRSDYENFLAGRGPDPTPTESTEGLDSERGLEFALEAHLRDFLARNLERIEPGLRLYTSGDRDGVEFPVDGGRIDLLAVDRNGKHVVLELKLSQGRNKTLGQLLYYMGWVDQHLGNGPCRGFIIANEITPELVVAVSRVPGVSLARYEMAFSIQTVAAV